MIPGVAGEEHPGVVHPHRELPECGGLVGNLAVRRDIPDILGESDRAAPDLGCRTLGGIPVDIGDDDPVACVGETSGKGKTDSTAGSGDDCCCCHGRTLELGLCRTLVRAAQGFGTSLVGAPKWHRRTERPSPPAE